MSLRNLPEVMAFERPDGFAWDAPSQAIERWAAAPVSADGEQAEVTIFDYIGESWDGSGMTSKRMAGILRAIGEKPLTVAINSPGGDMFEGLAIYNMLRQHKSEITVKVMGYAASAASVIAMAGDKIQMGLGSFFMIHNAWGVVVGDRTDFTAAAATFAKFDAAMGEIYTARTGVASKKIADMMNAETWISAQDAKDLGFADEIVDAPKETTGSKAKADVSARRRLESMLANQGMSRSERRRLIGDALGTPSAAAVPMPGAGIDRGGIAALIQTIKTS